MTRCLRVHEPQSGVCTGKKHVFVTVASSGYLKDWKISIEIMMLRSLTLVCMNLNEAFTQARKHYTFVPIANSGDL
jgi:hypothetical protein